MKIRKLLRPFRQKLLLEDVVGTLLLSLGAGAGTVFLISLVYHILLKPTPWKIPLIGGGAVFALCAVVSFILRYHTDRRVAARVDELGLKERTGTMLALQKETKPIALLQRQDAIAKLWQTSPRQMKFRVAAKEMALGIVAVVLAAVIVILPYDVFSLSSRNDLGEENRAFINSLIEDLRKELEEAELDEEVRRDLEEILRELEEQLRESESELDQAAEIQKAKEEMEERLNKEISSEAIGRAMMDHQLTRALGESIRERNTERVKLALNELEKDANEDDSVIAELADELYMALDESGVEETDELYIAVEAFAAALQGTRRDSDTFQLELDQSFEDARYAIVKALEEEEKIHETKKALEKMMEEAKKEALGQKQKKESGENETATSEGKEGESETGEEGQKESQTEEKGGSKKPPSGEDSPPQDGHHGSTQGGDVSDPREMTEELYDPLSGKVEYGKVFALYYAEYLAALEKGEVDGELQSMMDRYYSSLN